MSSDKIHRNPDALGQVIAVTSGKGGVGKTTSSAALSVCLASLGHHVVVVDFDVGLRNLDLIMGCERRVVYDIIHVIQGDVKLNQALIRDKRCENLYILPASQTKDKDALTLEGVGKIIEELKKQFDFIICDSPAGIEQGAMCALYYADHAIVVTNPEISSVRDSDRMIGLIASKSYRAENNLSPVKEHLLITRYHPTRVQKGEMLSKEDVVEILSVSLLGVIPESESVLKASNQGQPVSFDKESPAAQAYFDASRRLLGEDLPLRFVDTPKSSIFSKIYQALTESVQ